MLSIKFRDRKRINVKVKFEIINAIFDIIDIERRKEIFYSDYTFSKVEESKNIDWLDDLLKNNILDELNNDQYITITAIAHEGPILVEINPNIARKNVFNCSHIDISIENDTLLYDIFKDNQKINLLKDYFDRKRKDIISEFYFVNLSKTSNCYSDIKSRLFTKFYDEFEFSNLLLKDEKFAGRLNDRLGEKIIKTISLNFTSRIFQERNQCFVQNLISENNLDLSCVAGSLEFHGSDVSEFVDLIIEKLNTYIDLIVQKDIYTTEFDKLVKFECKNERLFKA